MLFRSLIRLDGEQGRIEVLLDPAEWQARAAVPAPQDPGVGSGRELFAFMRAAFSPAEQGASVFTQRLEQLHVRREESM